MRHQISNWLLLLTAVLFFAGNASAWQESAKTAEDESAKKAHLAELLELLKEQNKGPDRFKDAWCITLMEIIEIGPVGAPQLIAELDATNDDMMLRCMGFTLRAIGDKRAVPALIRAIPKTLRKPGSDMGLRSGDETIAAFMQMHDMDEHKEKLEFGFKRPVREIIGALQKLTGQSFEDDQIYSVFLDGTVRQRRMRHELYYRQAQKWADWWEANSASLVDEPYRKVNLPKLEEKPEPNLAKNNLQHYKTDSGGSNWILEPFSSAKAETVFYDFDTGRRSGLPKKWKSEKYLEAKFAEIEKWATDEGFDLMGAEYLSPTTGKSHFALRPLRLEVWELGKARWKMHSEDITFEELVAEGKSVSNWLLHRDQEQGRFAPEEIATFLFRTKDGTPGLVFVGIEVHDDSLQPGGISDGDNELRPIAFRKGRRFGFKFFEELEEK
jgi:hypothetical protein